MEGEACVTNKNLIIWTWWNSPTWHSFCDNLPSNHGAYESVTPSLADLRMDSGRGMEWRTMAPYRPYSAITLLRPQHFSLFLHLALRFWNHTWRDGGWILTYLSCAATWFSCPKMSHKNCFHIHLLRGGNYCGSHKVCHLPRAFASGWNILDSERRPCCSIVSVVYNLLLLGDKYQWNNDICLKLNQKSLLKAYFRNSFLV